MSKTVAKNVQKDLRMVNVLRDDPSIGEIVDSWHNGNCNEILDNLWQYPPHVTAFFMWEMQKRHNSQNDINLIVNGLMDRFMVARELYQ